MPSKSLKPTYNGPYRVIHRSDKTFVVNIKDKNVTVSIDRLKPAYIIPEEDEPENRTLQDNQPKAKDIHHKTATIDNR